MGRLLRLLTALVIFELISALMLVGLRLNSTRLVPPLVEQYNDAVFGRELVALPDSFLFDSTAKWQTLGETYMAFGRFSKAEGCLQRAVQSAPRSAEIAFLHGYSLERLGKIDAAKEAFGRAATQGAGRIVPRAWYRLGRMRLQSDDAAEAARAFESAGDDHLPSVFQRAKLLIRSGEASRAEALLEILSEAHPDDAHVWQLKARAAAESGRQSDAIAAWDAFDRAGQTLALDDMDAVFEPIRNRFGLGRELERAVAEHAAGRSQQAAERMTRVVDGGNGWQNTYLFLLLDAAEMQVMAENAPAARALLARQIKDEEFLNPKVWKLLGDVEFLERRPEEALAAYTRADRMQPTIVDHWKLGSVFERLGNVAEAQRYLGLAGQFAGIGLFRKNNLHEARTTLKKAAPIQADLPSLWFYLGQTERLLGNNREAEAAYGRCLALNPNHGRALVWLDRLSSRDGMPTR